MLDARNALTVRQLSVRFTYLFTILFTYFTYFLLQSFWNSQRMHPVCLKAIKNPQINKVINLRKTPGRFLVGQSG